MTSFIVSAIVLVLLAVVFIVPTLRRKNYAFSDEYDDLNIDIAKDRLKELKVQLEAGEISQQIYQQMHDELESTLALDLANESKKESISISIKEKNSISPIVFAVFIPLMAIVVYYQLGDFEAATGTRIEATQIPAAENRQQMSLEDAVIKLEQRLAEQPENPEGWFMLAKTYMTMKYFHKAVTAYEKVISQVGEEPEVLLRYADALAMTEGGSLNGAAKPVVDKIIRLLPDNPAVLWMAGTAENQQGNHAKALTYWYRLRPMLTEEADSLAQLDALIKGSESQLNSTEMAELKQADPLIETSVVEATVAAEIVVTVELDPAFKDKVLATDTLFIFAKAMQGPPMPLAAVKQTVSALPITVSLNDAMAMMPQMKLSNFDQVKILAVISKSGQPGTQPGDLFAEVSPVNVKNQEKVKLVINQVK
ncbi:MAG: c-type cytochrome biogenesis protein CcmI [Gammaproteobacteria bacterium]|nr:c-type cytochrome biogenesis protein CcmI [Gammaproteobacteria bacterium]